MAVTKLFSYNIEENEGKLVITIEGLYAQTAIKHLRSEVETGRGWRALARMSPVGPLNRLSRQAARLHELEAQNPELDTKDGAAPIDLDVIFNQGFAETYQDFGNHLDRFAQSLVQLKAEFDAGQAAKKAPEAAPGDKKPAAK